MKYAALVLCLMPLMAQAKDSLPALTDKAFQAEGGSKGVVVLNVNWGRQWNCHGYDNVQLQKLEFQTMPAGNPSPERIELETPSKLRAKNEYQRYAFLIPPGEYALSGFRFKLAAGEMDVRNYELGPEHLLRDGKAQGGTFRVAKGEIVYIGHFSMDCNGDPTPWRFYIDHPSQFKKYSKSFYKEFPATKAVPITYRLFETELLGRPYELPVDKTVQTVK